MYFAFKTLNVHEENIYSGSTCQKDNFTYMSCITRTRASGVSYELRKWCLNMTNVGKKWYSYFCINVCLVINCS